jgi:hypothetical protein
VFGSTPDAVSSWIFLASFHRAAWEVAGLVKAKNPKAPVSANRLGSRRVPADHRLRLENFQCVQYSRSHTIEPRKHQAVNVAEGQSLRGLRRSTLSWCRRTRISACNAARDRNSPIKAHQINLQRSLIRSEYQPIRGRGQLFWVCGRDSGISHIGLVSVCGNSLRNRDSGALSPRALFWCLVFARALRAT